MINSSKQSVSTAMESGYYENLKDQINKDGIQVYNIYTQPLFRIIHGKYYDFYMSSVNDDQIILTVRFILISQCVHISCIP